MDRAANIFKKIAKLYLLRGTNTIAMTDANQPADLVNWDPKPKKIPEMLNVLSILTFIACGLGIISSCYSFFNAQKSYDTILSTQDKLANAPDIIKKLAGPDMLEIARKTLDNRLPLNLLYLVGYALCIYGVLQMRAMKKAGFPIYLIGEVVPVIAMFIFIGAMSFSGFVLLSALVFPVVFIILYATQLKYLS
jgi:hypothetical protein